MSFTKIPETVENLRTATTVENFIDDNLANIATLITQENNLTSEIPHENPISPLVQEIQVDEVTRSQNSIIRQSVEDLSQDKDFVKYNQFEMKNQEQRAESPTHSSQQFATISDSQQFASIQDQQQVNAKKVNVLQQNVAAQQQILQVVSPLFEQTDVSNFIPSPDPQEHDNMALNMEDLQLSDEEADPNILESLVYKQVENSHTVERLDKVINEAGVQQIPPKPLNATQNIFKNGPDSLYDFQRKSQISRSSRNSSFNSNASYRTDQTAFKQNGADCGQTRESVISQAFSEMDNPLDFNDIFQPSLTNESPNSEMVTKEISNDDVDKDTKDESRATESESKQHSAVSKHLFVSASSPNVQEKAKKKNIFSGFFKRK